MKTVYVPNKSSLLVAALASVGALISPTAPAVTLQYAAPTEARQPASIANGTGSRQIQQDHFGDYSLGMFNALMRDTGMSHAAFGQTPTCKRMMRRSHLRNLGIGRRKG